MYKYTKSQISAALQNFGFSTLRPQQKAPLDAILQGEDVLVKMPTSGGKSLLFQLPAVLEADQLKLTVVLSPLKALQADQVTALLAKGIPAAWINSDLKPDKKQEILENFCAYGGLLYMAPEQLENKYVADMLAKANISRVAVDEAHILPQVKSDFRRSYGRIGEFIQSLPRRPQVLALTATATQQDTQTIRKSLKMLNVKVFNFPIRRCNLHLSVKRIESAEKKNIKNSKKNNLFLMIERELRRWDGKGSAIIYCSTTTLVESLSNYLKSQNYSIGKYHGKMDRQKREKAQKKFMSGEKSIMVATNAFGLGIDKPDIRLIIHAGLPLTFDGYVQEIGRAGRDGKKSRCVLFYSDSNFKENEFILRQSAPEATFNKVERLNALHGLLEPENCLWQVIERYFGEKGGKRCKHCCHCKLHKLSKYSNYTKEE